jgi:hypothetical protein
MLANDVVTLPDFSGGALVCVGVSVLVGDSDTGEFELVAEVVSPWGEVLVAQRRTLAGSGVLFSGERAAQMLRSILSLSFGRQVVTRCG